MNILTTNPLATLIDNLFEEAASSSPLSNPEIAALSEDERESKMRSKTDYFMFYENLREFPLAVSRKIGILMYMLARNNQAKLSLNLGRHLVFLLFILLQRFETMVVDDLLPLNLNPQK